MWNNKIIKVRNLLNNDLSKLRKKSNLQTNNNNKINKPVDLIAQRLNRNSSTPNPVLQNTMAPLSFLPLIISTLTTKIIAHFNPKT